MRVWIDIENPPQVQYLAPLERAFSRAGHEVIVTARDYGIAFDLLRARGVEFHAVGESYGPGAAHKLRGLVRRTASLVSFFRKHGRPDASISASRAAPLAASIMGLPAFSFGDYEHVNVTIPKLARCYVFHPAVLDQTMYLSRGIRAGRLLPFRGLKEDLSFWEIDLDAVAAYSFPELDDSVVKVLVRPAAEDSHYYRAESGSLTSELLHWLAQRGDAVVIFSPRYPRQVGDLGRFAWVNRPVVLEQGVPFVPLLKGVDLVISSGGTMLREAAYLGTPAYSTFRGKIGGVDRYLESVGRLRLIASPDDFACIEIAARPRKPVLATNTRLPLELAETVISLTGSGDRDPRPAYRSGTFPRDPGAHVVIRRGKHE